MAHDGVLRAGPPSDYLAQSGGDGNSGGSITTGWKLYTLNPGIALKAGRPGRAGLDVYDVEPLPLEHELRKLDNAVITPHLGYVTQEGYLRFYVQMVEDVGAWQSGKPVRVLQPR